MDDQLRYKLTRFEADPPEGAWNKIVQALDNLDNDQPFPERLYHYAETPPPENWDRIVKMLDGEAPPAKVIPFATRFKKPLRYAAAASVIGVLLIASTLLLKRTEAGALQAGSETTVPVKPTVVPLPGPGEVRQNNGATVFAAAPKRPADGESALNKRLLALIQPQKLFASVAIGRSFIPKKVSKKAMFSNALLTNYMVVSNGDGLAMRMPKKLFPLVQCDDGDASCRQRIKDLQQKLSAAALTTDFPAILEMLRQVQ